jgi:hypothetical protein
LHAASIIARADVRLPDLEDLATTAMADETITIYGLATSSDKGASECSLAWTALGPLPSNQPDHSHMAIRPWGKVWQLQARLHRAELPDGPIGMLAPQLFALADEIFGTDFGALAPPFGLAVPAPRRP